MTPLQLELTRLIGDKTLSFGCLVKLPKKWICFFVCREELSNWTFPSRIFFDGKKTFQTSITEEIEILWHPVTETNFKKWMNEKGIDWKQNQDYIAAWVYVIPYSSNLPLLEQSEETLTQILNLITNNK